jgi:hypothetical protein
MNKLKRALCLRCRTPNKDHSFNEALKCKYLLELAHTTLLQRYNILKNSSETEPTELEDK